MNQTNQSDELTAFYQDYLAWVEAGAVEVDSDLYGYSRGSGLCSSLSNFCWRHEYYQYVFHHEMKKQFEDAGLSSKIPFNSNIGEYSTESIDDTIHLNPKRITWVKDHTKG